MSESSIVREIQLAAPALGARLFRNNVGRLKEGARYVQYGLTKGSADLIGWTHKGQFLAVECKVPGREATPQQLDFLYAVAKSGGVAIVAHSVSEFIHAYGQAHK